MTISSKRQKRDKVIALKVTPNTYQALHAFADSKGITVSTLCHLWVVQELGQLLGEHSSAKPLIQGDLYLL